MILKSISVKGSPANLVRYILKEKGRETSYANYVNKILQNEQKTHGIYVCGIPLSEEDLKHLVSEKFDAAVLQEFKEFKGTVQAFIDKLTTTNNREVASKQKQNAKEEATVLLRHNIRSLSASAIIDELKANEERRTHKSANAIAATHTILSFSNKEIGITDAVLKDIANEYVRLRGESNLFLVVKHAERAHVHLHIAMSATSLNGKSSRISKAEFAKIKVELDEYQRKHYPQLVHSLPKHGKGEIKNIFAERTSQKSLIQNTITTKLQEAISTNDFILKLKEAGLSAYYRGDRLTGVKTESEIKYRFSRLGVDTSRLKELDDNLIREEKLVDELRQLRERGHREMQPRVSAQAESRLSRFENELSQSQKSELSEHESATPENTQDTPANETTHTSDQKENDITDDAGKAEDEQIQDHTENEELSIDDF